MPAHTLTDRALPLDALWGRAARELTARLGELGGTAEQRALIEEALLVHSGRLAAPVPWVEGAVTMIRAGGSNMRTVAHALGASARRLERAFREHVGVGPKRFARIVRLARARSALSGGASQLEAALAAGYYDQAHLHRDCRALAGVGPAELIGPSRSYKRASPAADQLPPGRNRA